MIMLNSRNKDELLTQIKTLDGVDSELYISLRPTKEIIDELVKQNTTVKKVYCPPSLYLQVSKKVFRALDGVDLELKPGDFKAGRPKKYASDTITQIIGERSTGKSARKISEEHNIPLRTVYYHLKNGNNR